MTDENQERSADHGGSRTTQAAVDLPWLARLGLVFAAFVVVAWNWDGAHHYALVRSLDALGGEGESGIFFAGQGSPRRLTKDQKFLLEGDRTRSARHQQQRAIWEAHPESRVYLGNYITALQATGSTPESVPLDAFRGELAAARKLEPENARFDYLEAARLLGVAAEIRSETVGTDEKGGSKTTYSLEVRDRDQLDEAMDLLRQGLAKPYWRRYAADMLEEQLAVLGPPRRFADLVQRTAISAGTLLPDLAQFRNLARASRLYAEQLIAEARSADAIRFLEAWETLARHLAEDSFTLIDVLVAGAVANDAAQSIPPIYRQLARETDAGRTAARAAAIAKPVNDWREQRDLARGPDPQSAGSITDQQVLLERAGVFASLLLPALGQWPDAREYEPGRMLEYAVFTEFLVAAILAVLLVAMLVSGLLALRWRIFRPENESRPPILLPDPGTIFRIMMLGVIVPLVLFFLATRFVPWSGHEYSMRVGMHKLMAEFGLLAAVLLTLPILMTLAHVKRHCRARGVTVARWQARYLSWPLGGAGVLLLGIAWFLPPTLGDAARTPAVVGLGFVAASLVAGIILGLAQGLAGQRQYGIFYGSAFRTLVPMLALTVIVLGVTTRPVLLRAEAGCIGRDTLMQDRDRVGFTRLENDLVHKLRTAMIESFRQGASIQTPGG